MILIHELYNCMIWFTLQDQEELVEESKTKSQEIKGDDSFITPIDLEKKREEEQKIKMSWVNLSLFLYSFNSVDKMINKINQGA